MMYRKVLRALHVRNYNTTVRCCSSRMKPMPDYNNRVDFSEIIESEQPNYKDWTSFTESILQKINNDRRERISRKNIDNAVLSHCVSARKFDLAEKYLDHLQETRTKPNLANEGKILRLLYHKHQLNCSEKDQRQIFDRYDNLRKQYDVLDSITLEHCVLALSVTNRWRECLKLLDEIRISTGVGYFPYSAVISAAFENGEHDLGFEILERMFRDGAVPYDMAYTSYVNNISKISDRNEYLSKIERLFNYFKDKEVICSLGTIESIAASCQNKKVQASFVALPFRGHCTNCNQRLNKIELTESEFDELRTIILKNVIVGRDVFTKTNPDELERFKEFVGGMGKFDVVLDGLNVAYSVGSHKGPKVYADLVSAVVSHFRGQGKSVLLLGRVHMQRWPRPVWDNIRREASIFLTQNISQDDPYLLYCAVSSGRDTIIVTRDLMRGHKFLLGEQRLKLLFDRWLAQRQHHLVRVDADRRLPLFRIPPLISPLSQKIRDFWHIPYESQNELDNKNYQKTWLCIRTKP